MDFNQSQTDFIATEIELVYHSKTPASNRLKIQDSDTAYEVLKRSWDMNKIELVEHGKLLLLARDKSLLGVSHLSSGGITSCIIDPKIVFATALKAAASCFILAHNHPSGNLQPGKADLDLTNRIYAGAELLSLEFVDHIIVAPTSHFSFATEGLMPK